MQVGRVYGISDYFNKYYYSLDNLGLSLFNISDKSDKITYRLDLPGVKKSDIDVMINDDSFLVVNVNGHRHCDDYKRTYQTLLNKRLDYDSVNAELVDGILSITFDKVDKKKIIKIK